MTHGAPSTCRNRLRIFARDEQGQALPVITLAMMTLLACSAFAIDYSRSAYAERVLQETTDAAALAAAQAIPTASSSSAITGSTGVVMQYSAASGERNATSILPSVTVDSTLKCLVTIEAQGIPCVGNVPYNAVQVKQTASFPMYFWKVFGHPTMNLIAVSTAAIRGGAPKPSNIAVVMDSTLSMTQWDSNCGNTQMQCALNGFQVLLKSMQPCSSYLSKCPGDGSVSFDRVALFTFPNVSGSTMSQNTSCTSAIPSSYTWDSTLQAYIVMPPNSAFNGIATAVQYTFPTSNATSYSGGTGQSGTYQVTSFVNDYKSANTDTVLASTSKLVKAAGGASNCGGVAPSNFDGIYGTYYPGAIYAAQSALTAEKSAFPDADNVMIILGDGDNTAPAVNGPYAVISGLLVNNIGTYPSAFGECGQSITAAKAATAAGTMVYTVAYGAQSTGCTSDAVISSNPGINPCDTMYYMATAPEMFYSDYNQSGSNSTCYASQPVTSLNDIFQSIAKDLTKAHLIPNSTT